MQLPKDKGVSLGSELEAEIAKVLARRYRRYLSPGECFVIKTEVGHAFAALECVFYSTDHDQEYSVDLCLECETNKIQNPMDAHSAALDAMDDVWAEFFESDRIFHYSENWLEYSRGEHKVLMRVEHRSPKLDASADEFLRQHGLDEFGEEIQKLAEDDS
ncbi:MAG: hypothetical protein WC966_01370 [Bradymonadales bacterium]